MTAGELDELKLSELLEQKQPYVNEDFIEIQVFYVER